MRLRIRYLLIFSFTLIITSCSSLPQKNDDPQNLSWDQVTQKANGQTINLMMWQGDPYINDYMNNYVVPALKKKYAITLNISGGQGNVIVSILMTEQQAGKGQSEIDMGWINGETFYQLRQVKALYGPFEQQLPNAKYIDFDNPFIKYDFQQPIDGYEMPWGNVQMILICNSNKVKKPPRNMKQLAAYVKQHPATFTFPNQFIGLTFLKSLLISIAGKGTLDGPFDKQKYQKYSSRLWAYINRIKPYFWKEGETFPATKAAMNQMFASGELNFTITNNDNSVDNKVMSGFFPKSARGYVFKSGTIQNSHYMGIVKRSAHKAAAMVVCNFLVSPEAQYQKMKPSGWGDRTVLAIDKLPKRWKQKFRDLADRKYAPPRKAIQPYALQELDPEYMIHLNEDFRKKVIEQ